MSGFSQLALQKAVFQKFTADSTLMGMVTGIYDRVPEGSAFPYISIGETTCTDRSNMATNGTEHMETIHVWSREGGRKQALTIMERIYTLLHQGTLSVEGQSLMLIRFAASQVQMQGDGSTYMGMMRFRVLLDAA